MISQDTTETYPELGEILKHIDERIAAASCPPEMDIWDSKRLLRELNISTRTAAYLRSKKILPYSKVEGLIYYLKSDVLDMLRTHRIEAISKKNRLKIR